MKTTGTILCELGLPLGSRIVLEFRGETAVTVTLRKIEGGTILNSRAKPHSLIWTCSVADCGFPVYRIYRRFKKAMRPCCSHLKSRASRVIQGTFPLSTHALTVSCPASKAFHSERHVRREALRLLQEEHISQGYGAGSD